MNGSPLFTGDAGSGESEIRRWILENDWLEAIVALPEQLFYNTGIATYIWILSNQKQQRRKGKVQLIDATSFWVPMRKSLGDKRREISLEHRDEITTLFKAFKEGEQCKILNSTDFGFRKITVERPLRLNFQASPERIERVKELKVFQALTKSQQKDASGIVQEDMLGWKKQISVAELLQNLPDMLYKDCDTFRNALTELFRASSQRMSAPLQKALLAALSERDETAQICRDKDGNPEPDADLRDTENIPLDEDINAYFEREVKPHVSDAWVSQAIRDQKDDEVGKVGYEINFNRYFYTYQPPRPLEEIEADIQVLEQEIVGMLREVAG